MFRKILGACVSMLFLGSSFASVKNPLFVEKTYVQLGKCVASGASDSVAMSVEVTSIKVAGLETLREKSELVKNIYLAFYHSDEAMTTFRTACLTKILEIADSYSKVETESVDYKVSKLLYYSQVSDNEKELLQSARVEIVENVINRLSKAVNGDKTSSFELLNKFYGLLKGTRFGDFVPCD